ncbi:MAG: TonB-dependent receptor [Clostridium sp.]|nr:TonB-dependent receptor [Prevotella sp.]MCM1428964.1 TonB-dependent receptor [Clostridium sp.]MCM1475998.1 TonB-dependent receptor [Muribaculaceae bacterium]
MVRTKIAVLIGVISLLPQYIRAEEKADTSARALKEVVVTAERNKAEVIPVQTLSGEELQRLNSNSVADALRYFAGVQVKDYGGVGGIKTVNVRSMGTNHTGVVYDGVQLGNAQNGQIDLGQFSLDNIEAISLHNGQKSQILQPARDFGSAGTIYMQTRTPHFSEGESYHLRAGLRFGSFDLINPSAVIELKLTERVNASLSAEWLNSSGKYKFRYRRVNPAGEVAYDTTAVRQNGDINATRLELNINGALNSGTWHLKFYNYNSERGVPGAIVNNVWRRGERIWDTNSFAQGRYQQTFGDFTTLTTLKYAFYRTHYVNNDDKQVKIDNLYRQREIYLSSANEYRIAKWLRVSVSYDFMWNTLKADMYDFAKPDRYTNLIAAAASVDLGRFKAQASGLGTFIHDRLEGKEAPADKHEFTPAVYASFAPLSSTRDFTIRAFYKRSFRMPTFNDLYYADMGNSKLEPERVSQYNVGLLWDHYHRGTISHTMVSVDGYYNRVKDKIVAYPKGQQFRWTMLNLGLVDIKGIDVSAQMTVNPVDELYLTLRGQYTFQRAIDITNPADNYYRDQIPYIPRHSGSAILNAGWRGWNLNYSFIYVGERYNQQENIRYNYTQPWYTSDISASKDFQLGKAKLRVLVEVNNLLSQDYDVIINYPMPKRNFRVSLNVEI